MSETENSQIVLYTPYYRTSSAARQKEIDLCLRVNVDCPHVDRIVVLIDDDSEPPIDSSRIDVVRLKERPKYSDWVSLSDSLPEGTISLLANSDIYFDGSLTHLSSAISDDNTFMALSRYDPDGQDWKIRSNPHWTQDTWGYRVSRSKMDQNFLRSLSVPLGVPRCDNKVAYAFAIRGWKIVNPCRFVRSVHVHDTNERGYDKKRDRTVLGGVAYVYPGDTIDGAAPIDVDVWASGCGAIRKVALNKSLDSWEAANVEPPVTQSILGDVSKGEPTDRAVERQDRSFLPVSVSETAEAIFNGKVIFEFRSRFKAIEHKGFLYFVDSLQIKRVVKLEDWDTSNYPGGVIPVTTLLSAFVPACMDVYPMGIRSRPASNDDINFWQYPALTEFKAYENHARLKIGSNVDISANRAHVYIGLPWATYIDKRKMHDDLMAIVRVRIEGWQSLAKSVGFDLSIHTVCQHIHWSRIIDQCLSIGITDLHVSHMKQGDDRRDDGLRIHGWPLIAVNVENEERRAGLIFGKAISGKKYLASFIGAYAKNYRSLVRPLLRDESERDGGEDILFELKDEWHYQRVVYREQVKGESLQESDHVFNERETRRYNEVMSNSVFSLCPEGSGPNSLRIWESMAVGSLPVIVTDDWSRVDTHRFGIEMDECCIFVNSGEIRGLFERLRRIPRERVEEMQRKCLDLYAQIRGMLTYAVCSPAAPTVDAGPTVSVTPWHDFKPSYVWPNPAFPFRVYFDDPRCRIFIIENIQHNWLWLSKYHHKIRSNDVFFVLCGWFHGVEFAREADSIFRLLDLRKRNFLFLYNSQEELDVFSLYGFHGHLIPQNSWLDENLIMKPMDMKKLYDAVYVARRSAFKRHYLAREVSNLALVSGINHGNPLADIPPHIYANEKPLMPAEVCEKINQSMCGLLLSEVEGGCYASSEYLLCGVPVVSTPCKGGRDIWYNDYNSIVCDPNPTAVGKAVTDFVNTPRDPGRIRAMHLEQANAYRAEFVNILRSVFKRFGIDNIDADHYFLTNFFHKMRKSYRPDFDGLFF